MCIRYLLGLIFSLRDLLLTGLCFRPPGPGDPAARGDPERGDLERGVTVCACACGGAPQRCCDPRLCPFPFAGGDAPATHAVLLLEALRGVPCALAASSASFAVGELTFDGLWAESLGFLLGVAFGIPGRSAEAALLLSRARMPDVLARTFQPCMRFACLERI